uniref:Integrase catalytic domain-containing protein n=1 Tax=Fagus sylvatica TaxID=28930 RepID=A0A2N9HWS0_FAGSY
MVLPAGSIRTWEDMVESFCSKYFHVEEKITLVNLHSTKQQTGKDLVKYIHRFRDVSLDCHVKYQEGELIETLTISTTATASGTKRKNSTEKVYEEPPPLPFTVEEMMAIFDKWVQDQVIKLLKITKQPTAEEQKDPKYCRYHEYVHHPTVDCRTLRWEVNRKIQDDTLQLSEEQQKVHKTPFPNYKKDKNKAVVSVVIHGNVSDMEVEEFAAATRNATTEALITIAAESGATCFTAKAHANRVFLETTNAITFTDEDMEVQYPDHRRPLYLSAVVKDVQVRRALVDTGSCLNLILLSTLQAANVSQQKIQGSPMEVTGFGGVTEYTMGHVLLVLRVGPIVALTRFQVVNAETPYHVLFGRPWLHKHKLVSSTYHQCVKGRLNGKPIRIATNSSPFDQTEAHFVEAALYDDLASTGEPSIVRPYGTPLPAWEDIKDDLEQEGLTPEEGGLQPSCHLAQQTENSEEVMVDQAGSTAVTQNPEEAVVDQTESTAAKKGKSTTAEPKMTAKEELEVINLSDDPDVSKPISISMSLSAEERKCLIDLLHEYKDVFTWDYDEMSGIDPRLVAHSLNVEPETRPVDEFPLPNMDLLIDSAAGHAMFSFMDRFSGYNQICMSTKDAEKTAFRTPIGNFYYTVMLFGLKNTGATYQRTMTAMFHDMMHKKIEDYVNDIVVKSKKREEHLETLRKMFDRCRLYKLKMNPLKCAFGVSAGKFLGFLVHNRGIDVDPAKASAIATMKAPTSHKELKSFFRRLSYIMRFIPSLAAVTAVFTPLMKKGVPFVWSMACQQAFEKIQVIMTKLPTVCAPAPSRPLRLYLASNKPSHSRSPCTIPGRRQFINLTRSTGRSRRSTFGRSGRLYLYAEIDGSSTSNSSGAGIVLIREDGETIAKSFKLNFSCSNNASEYEAYITGLAIAHEMGIKHLRVIADSNLIICQTKGEFSLKEPSLALYRALAQKLEEKFDTFEISHAMRCGNRYVDALATLGSQVSFEGPKVDVTIDKRTMSITDLLKEKFKEQNFDGEDWRIPIRAKLMSLEGAVDLKTLKHYVLITGDLYRRLPGGVLARCVNLQEAAKKLTEVHEKSCEFRDGVSLYRRLQRLGYFWPNMSKEAANLQEQCSFCQHQHESDQVYATFVSNDWRTPFLEYLIENILPQTSKEAVQLKKLAARYFVEGGILFRKGFHSDPLKCLSLAESQTVMKEAHSKECGEHQGKKRLYQLLLTLDLIGPINPPSGGYIWILMATEYFSKWVEAVPLRKATGAAVTNFIREHIITRFDIPHKIISDNGTPFVNKSVREVLEHYRIKHRRSTPYYPQGNGQAETTNRMLLRILSKMVFDYGKSWSSHLADTLWAYRGSTKTATGFTPFSLVYGTDAISPTELLVPSPRILQGMDFEADTDICAEARVADLESLEEARELAQVRSLRYHQKLVNVYEKTLQTRVFAEGQTVLRTVDHVRRGLPSPSKFAPNWEGPYLIREAYDSGYYKLSMADGTILADPINRKWLKGYYS